MYKIILSSLALALSGTALAQTSSRLEPQDIFALEIASDAQISPDGQQIAYVRRSNDIATDQTLSHIWLVNADGSNHRALNPDGPPANTPRWSPDSASLAYLQPDGESLSLRINTPGTDADREIARIRGGAAGLAWSPDGERLAYAGFVAETGTAAAELPARGDDMEWATGAHVEDRLFFRIDGVGELPVGNQQLFVVALDGTEPTQLTFDDASGDHGATADFAWSSDGSAILFSADRRADSELLAPDNEIYRLDLADGEITALTSRAGPDTSPRPSPDGRHIAYLGYDEHFMGYDNTRLYVANADGSEPRALTEAFDRSFSSPQWSSDGQSLYALYEDRGDTVIARVDLEGGIEPLTGGVSPSTLGRPYTGGDFTMSRDGHIATTSGSAARPAEIAILPPNGTLQRLTDLNSDLLDGRSVSDAEEVTWTSPYDGEEIQGWVLYPPEFDPQRQYPMILEIHGGPFTAYGPVFAAELQLMAASGYVVLYTNPRGSTSYGYDFANLIHHDYPGHDYDDLMGGVDALLARGFIDPERLFVTGGSGGGVLTAWIVGSTDRFAAAAVVKPVINWSSFVLYSDLPQYFFRYWFASAPWEDPAEYWRRSPLSLVGNVSTPTLVMVGGADIRTPRSEAEQYYSALRLRNVPSRLVIIPDAFHGIADSRPSRLLSKSAEILRWFDTYDHREANIGD